MTGVRVGVLNHLDEIAKYCGTDIFLINPKHADEDGPATSYGNGSDLRFDQRLRIAIYGDPESSEHAKTRVLILIDRIVSLRHSALGHARTKSSIAPPHCRCHETRVVFTHDHMWTDTQEHSID